MERHLYCAIFQTHNCSLFWIIAMHWKVGILWPSNCYHYCIFKYFIVYTNILVHLLLCQSCNFQDTLRWNCSYYCSKNVLIVLKLYFELKFSLFEYLFDILTELWEGVEGNKKKIKEIWKRGGNRETGTREQVRLWLFYF